MKAAQLKDLQSRLASWTEAHAPGKDIRELGATELDRAALEMAVPYADLLEAREALVRAAVDAVENAGRASSAERAAADAPPLTYGGVQTDGSPIFGRAAVESKLDGKKPTARRSAAEMYAEMKRIEKEPETRELMTLMAQAREGFGPQTVNVDSLGANGLTAQHVLSLCDSGFFLSQMYFEIYWSDEVATFRSFGLGPVKSVMAAMDPDGVRRAIREALAHYQDAGDAAPPAEYAMGPARYFAERVVQRNAPDYSLRQAPKVEIPEARNSGAETGAGND